MELLEERKEIHTNSSYGLIYKMTNLVNGKKYIGKTTKTLDKRIQTHVYSANSNSELILHRALRKYGIDNFEWEAIDDGNNDDELNVKEVHWINYHKTFIRSKDYKPWGYNMTVGGEGGGGGENHYNYGKTLSEEHRAKLSEAHKGKKASTETRAKMSRAHKGRKMPKKAVLRISNANRGRKFTEEHKEKLRKWHTGKVLSEKTKRKISENSASAREVMKITLDGEFVEKFRTIKDALKSTNGKSESFISSVCRGKRKSAYGFMWMYKEDYEELQGNVPKYKKNPRNRKGGNRPRKIIQLSKDGVFLKEWESMNKASKKTNTDVNSIARVAKGRGNTAGGYKWVYKENYEKETKE